MKTSVCLIYFVNDCLWKQFFTSNLPQYPSDLILWTILVTIRLFAQFQIRIRATRLHKSANFILLDNYFTNLFTEVQIRYRKTFKFGQERFQKDKVNFNQNMTIFNNWSC